MGTTVSKRANFDISPEQQEILMLAKVATNASNIKDGVLKACQLIVSLAQETAKGNQVFVGKSREKAARFIVPGLEKAPQAQWNWLVQRDHPWKTQLWVKGRKVMASSIWNDMRANGMSIRDAQENWELPEEAISEIVAYCEENIDLIQAEASEEALRLKSKGVKLEASCR